MYQTMFEQHIICNYYCLNDHIDNEHEYKLNKPPDNMSVG